MQIPITRRQLVHAGLAGSAAAAVLRPPDAAAAGAPAPGDSAVLARTLRTEQLVVIAYERVLASGLLAPAVSTQVRVLLGQEHQHVAALERSLRELGAVLPRTSESAARRALSAHHIHESLTGLRNQHECLKLLIDIESLAEGAYFAAISKLTDPSLLRTSVEAMGCEAQHWTVLSAIQNPGKLYRSVPYPFVQGST